MAQKWYKKASIQTAIISGIFALIAAIILGWFSLYQGSRTSELSQKTSPEKREESQVKISEINPRPYLRPSSTTERLVDNNDGTVTDTATDLMWTKKDNGKEINWYDAKEYCEDLELAGHKDWRLPTLNDLKTLYDPKATNSTPHYYDYPTDLHIPELFELTSDHVWSSTLLDSSQACCLRFTYGDRNCFRLTSYDRKRVLAVRIINSSDNSSTAENVVNAEDSCVFSGTMSTAAFTWSVDLTIGPNGITYKWNKFDESIPRYSQSSETYKRFGNRFIPWDSIAVWEGWYGGLDKDKRPYYRFRVEEKKSGDNWLTFIAYDKRVFECMKELSPKSIYRRGNHKSPVY